MAGRCAPAATQPPPSERLCYLTSQKTRDRAGQVARTRAGLTNAALKRGEDRAKTKTRTKTKTKAKQKLETKD